MAVLKEILYNFFLQKGQTDKIGSNLFHHLAHNTSLSESVEHKFFKTDGESFFSNLCLKSNNVMMSYKDVASRGGPPSLSLETIKLINSSQL